MKCMWFGSSEEEWVGYVTREESDFLSTHCKIVSNPIIHQSMKSTVDPIYTLNIHQILLLVILQVIPTSYLTLTQSPPPLTLSLPATVPSIDPIVLSFTQRNGLETSFPIYYQFYVKGFYITSGIQFGGDLLLYDKHPSHTHASAIVIICPPHQPISFQDWANLSRIALAVCKKVCFASLDDHGKLRTLYTHFIGTS